MKRGNKSVKEKILAFIDKELKRLDNIDLEKDRDLLGDEHVAYTEALIMGQRVTYAKIRGLIEEEAKEDK